MISRFWDNLVEYKQYLFAVLYTLASFWLAGYAAFGLLGIEAVPGVFDIFKLIMHYYDEPGVRMKIFFAAAIPIGLPIVLFLSIGRPQRPQYGDARWSSAAEIRKADLYRRKQDGGILLGKHNGKFLSAKGGQHVALYAPTGSNKGVGVVIPNLLAFPGSVICTDIKLENFEVTSTYRSRAGQDVYLFAPGKYNTHCWNVFDLVDKDSASRVNTLATIAQILCPTSDKVDTPMWSQEARALFRSAALAMMDTGESLNLSKLAMWVKAHVSPEGIKSFLEKNAGQYDIDPIAVTGLGHCAKMSPQHLSGVVSELTSKLEDYIDPLVAHAVSKSDFDIRDLRRKKMTIYLGVSVKSLKTVGPLFNLFFQMVSMTLTETLPAEDEKNDVLLLMDEFPALGKMDMIKQGIAYFRQYKLRLLIVAQGTAQLEDIYTETGRREFDTNCAFKLAYASNDVKEAEQLSTALGEDTITSTSHSRPTWFASKNHRSETLSTAGRKLLLPQEIIQFPRDEGILRVEALRPTRFKKIIYYDDPVFKGKFYNLHDTENTSAMAPVYPPDVDLTTVLADLRRLASDSVSEVSSGSGLDLGTQPVSAEAIGAELDDLSQDEIDAMMDDIFDNPEDKSSIQELLDVEKERISRGQQSLEFIDTDPDARSM